MTADSQVLIGLEGGLLGGQDLQWIGKENTIPKLMAIEGAHFQERPNEEERKCGDNVLGIFEGTEQAE